jgi:hypothetical protein
VDEMEYVCSSIYWRGEECKINNMENLNGKKPVERPWHRWEDNPSNES